MYSTSCEITLTPSANNKPTPTHNDEIVVEQRATIVLPKMSQKKQTQQPDTIVEAPRAQIVLPKNVTQVKSKRGRSSSPKPALPVKPAHLVKGEKTRSLDNLDTKEEAPQMISVMIEKFSSQAPEQNMMVSDPSAMSPSIRQRTLIGTENVLSGTTANDVCVRVMEKRQNTSGGMGIWLLQMKVPDPENYKDVEDGHYVTIKDPKYKLEQGKCYTVVYYSGMSGMLIK